MSDDFEVVDAPEWTATAGQLEAIEKIESFRYGKKPIGCRIGIIEGYAGTGKTSVLRKICEGMSRPFVLAPTGKAAVRIKEAAGIDAKTIHRWLYTPRMHPVTKEIVGWDLVSDEDIEIPENRILMIDEASMIQRQLFEDLLLVCKNHSIDLVLIGDGFQLPPVDKEGGDGFSVFKDVPHEWKVFLSEVVRQAQESKVLKAATAVRMGKRSYEALREIEKIPGNLAVAEMAKTISNGGAVICHTNKMRQTLNAEVRKFLGRPGGIEPQEPLMVTKNNYELDIFNGEIYNVQSVGTLHSRAVTVETGDSSKPRQTISVQEISINIDGKTHEIGLCEDVLYESKKMFANEFFVSIGIDKFLRAKSEREKRAKGTYVSATLGYALTVHKSQGSEWRDVIVVMEPTIRDFSQDGKRWLYTALTRSSETVRIVYSDQIEFLGTRERR